jgi:gliding motility-associated-like protein
MKLLAVITFIFIFFYEESLYAQNEPPKLVCITVNPDGSNLLRWLPPTNTTGLQKYLIYYSSALTGPFVPLAEIDNALLSTWLHTDANANNAPRRYYMIAEYELANSNSSDTLASIWMQVDNTNLTEASIRWNPPRRPVPFGSSETYEVYRALSDGMWSFRGTTTDTAFLDPVIICNDSVNYQVTLSNSNECQSVSSITGRRFRDITYPDKPLLDSVSVDINGNIQLGWTPSQAGDTYGYIIYRFENNTWQEIDTVFEQQASSYLDIEVNACSFSPQYAIAAFDSCENKSPGTFLTPQRTMLASVSAYNSCERSNLLIWTAYENPSQAIDSYRIWVSSTGDDFILLDAVSPASLTYTHENLIVGTTYHYKIQAIMGDASSSTCVFSSFTADYNKPAFINLRNVSVTETGAVELLIDADTEASIQTLVADRTTQLPQINPVTITWESENQSPVIRTDMEASTSDSSYYYSLAITDSCGFLREGEGLHRTILLTGQGTGDQETGISWNAYEGWVVEKYNVYRRLSGESTFSPIAELSATELTYTDNIAAVDGGDGIFNYRVEAVSANERVNNNQLSSWSNTISLLIESGLTMPNAFRPGGVNNSFGPVYRFTGYEEYSLLIFNRWGKMIFESNEVTKGWDGTYLGETVPSGVYAYLLSYRNQFGETIRKQGTVSVVY